MRTQRGVKAACITVLILILGMVPAGANRQWFEDPDDSDVALEVIEVGHGHSSLSGRRYLTHTIRMLEPWTNDALDAHSLIVWIDTDWNNRFNRGLHFGTNPDGSVYASVTGHPNGKGGFARVWRPDDRTIKAVFPKHFLGKDLGKYRYKVLVHENGMSCHGEPCQDFVPSGRPAWIVHELGSG